MLSRVLILLLFVPVTLPAQVFFGEPGVGAGFTLPVKTKHYDSEYGFGLKTFEELPLGNRLSLFSEAGLYAFRLTEQDAEYYGDKWNFLNFTFLTGPKIYLNRHYVQLLGGVVFGEYFNWALSPGFGFSLGKFDLNLRYVMGGEYAFFEIGINIFTL